MKKILVLFILLYVNNVHNQLPTYYGSFTVGGNSSNYYPVIFSVNGVDGTSSLGKLSIYIDNVHANGSWSGMFHFDVEFIPSNWGHIDTKIVSTTYITGRGSPYNDPIGDYIDGTGASNYCGGSLFVVWLKGGASYQWSCPLNSRVSLINGNSEGSSVSNTCGHSFSPIASQSQLAINAKNNKYLKDVGISIAGNGYFGNNVGIGTTSTGSFKLAVEGDIGARKVVVTKTSPFPDYVFNDDYKLQPLTQVEQFIKTNKHLPEIPTAKQVEKNGLEVGDNQILLLKKIEELTLYLIEQNKKTEKLEKENEEGLKEIKTLNNIVLQQQKEIEQLKAKK